MNKLNLKLLFAEDDEDTRKNYSEFFEMFCEKVYTAENGQEAFNMYTEIKPDVIILDINMPKMDGLTLSKKLRIIEPNLPIIIFSGNADQENLLDAIDTSITKFIVKPVKASVLQNTMETIANDILSKNKQHLKFDCDIVWDKNNSILYKENTIIKLSKLEQILLELLSNNPFRTFSNDDIINHIWVDDLNKEYDTKSLRALIYRIKTKLDCQIIESIYNTGYRLKVL